MTNNALIGVIAAIGGRNLKKEQRNQALVAALALGQDSAVSGFLVGQGAVDRSLRDEAEDELRTERARLAELDQQVQAAYDVAQAYDNMPEDTRKKVDELLGDTVFALAEAFRPATVVEEERTLPARSSSYAPRRMVV